MLLIRIQTSVQKVYLLPMVRVIYLNIIMKYLYVKFMCVVGIGIYNTLLLPCHKSRLLQRRG